MLPDGASSCPQCGYKLLGSTQAFAPVSVQTNAHTASSALLEEATLNVVRGPQIGNIYRLTAQELTIGRSPQCGIFLNDMTVSRMHATLRREAGGYRIIDADSFNGLWVNNLNVKDALLQDGDMVQIGTFCLVYQATPRM